jgi:Mg/Co/Ni transporter MgtE
MVRVASPGPRPSWVSSTSPIASVAGVLIPYGLHKLGRDPVMGSSVILTAITDSMGFFTFLRQRAGVGVGPGRVGYR